MEETKSVRKDLLTVFLNGFRNMFDYKSRASKYDYWGFVLMNTLVSTGLNIMIFATPLIGRELSRAFIYVYALVSFAAGISLAVRRLHDRNHSGLLLLPFFILVSTSFFSIISGSAFSSQGHSQLFFPLVAVTGFYGCYLLFLLLLKGNSVENKYGKPVAEPDSYNMWANIFLVVSLLVSIESQYYTMEKATSLQAKNDAIGTVDATASKKDIVIQNTLTETKKNIKEESVMVETPTIPVHESAEE